MGGRPQEEGVESLSPSFRLCVFFLSVPNIAVDLDVLGWIISILLFCKLNVTTIYILCVS
jgi:hypothetical protein